MFCMWATSIVRIFFKNYLLKFNKKEKTMSVQVVLVSLFIDFVFCRSLWDLIEDKKFIKEVLD